MKHNKFIILCINYFSYLWDKNIWKLNTLRGWSFVSTYSCTGLSPSGREGTFKLNISNHRRQKAEKKASCTTGFTSQPLIVWLSQLLKQPCPHLGWDFSLRQATFAVFYMYIICDTYVIVYNHIHMVYISIYAHIYIFV